MHNLIDLESYPLDQPDSDACRQLVDSCRQDLRQRGMFNLQGFLKPEACAQGVSEINPIMDADSFTHRRWHNIYFEEKIHGLEPDHPALHEVETVNHTVCADQIQGSVVMEIYEYPPLLTFLANVMNKPALYRMADHMAAANVMAYNQGEALNWHFDRSEFTTTLLLQEPEAGGVFEYRQDLRSDDNPNYDGVAKLLTGEDPEKKSLPIKSGTLNVFLGKNTAHRVTAIEGDAQRMIAVLSYYENPGRVFSAEERIGFYGRAE